MVLQEGITIKIIYLQRCLNKKNVIRLESLNRPQRLLGIGPVVDSIDHQNEVGAHRFPARSSKFDYQFVGSLKSHVAIWTFNPCFNLCRAKSKVFGLLDLSDQSAQECLWRGAHRQQRSIGIDMGLSCSAQNLPARQPKDLTPQVPKRHVDGTDCA